jgi:hypothetical protein
MCTASKQFERLLRQLFNRRVVAARPLARSDSAASASLFISSLIKQMYGWDQEIVSWKSPRSRFVSWLHTHQWILMFMYPPSRTANASPGNTLVIANSVIRRLG